MRCSILAISLCIYYSIAQAATITTNVDGVSTNAHGPLTAQIIATVVPRQDPLGQGPVGQPAPTVGTPHAPIPYRYTTTDASGQTTVVSDNYTPTFPRGQISPTLSTGTILNYSVWRSEIGTNTVAPAQTGAAAEQWRAGIWTVAGLTTIGGVLGGVWLAVF